MKNSLWILALIYIIGTESLFAWEDPESDCSIFTTYRYIYNESGESYRIFSAPKKYNECKKNHRIVRGEYETKEEFEARKKEQSSSCGIYDSIHNAKIMVSSKLKYNVDQGYFKYYINAGNKYYKCNGSFDNVLTSVKFKFGKKKVTKIDKKYIDSISAKWEDSSYHSGGHIEIKMFSPVEKARMLKVIENSLELRIYGDFTWYYHRAGKSKWKVFEFTVKHIVLFNKEENKPIFIID